MATTLTQTSPLSKTQRCYTVGYVPNRGDTNTPLLNLSGKWLREVGFDTGTSVTVKITEGCIVHIPDNDEVKELREQLKQIKQAVKVMNQGLAETV
ncbi:type I addiction module toxin, SymE family [Budviciaceae bacterium CWB-B4]|uniref:Type I addiction module toxin, SymE family n=1 Tax=Limnobaculum xujianqingii TaxID=2738837 RepID=A0A9D7AIQ6_9GAMM|nr:SymE family type I addiction module toxin [Limnobaculum xujianqingii]MBK5073511.1 type I addiction module toxin, SymE family [Limnobaculum xujianqingii]MBK5176758.1 type I addiction module toxin, SymE family [Limnobaculum xujianqingii]